jgi:hypothetical protein
MVLYLGGYNPTGRRDIVSVAYLSLGYPGEVAWRTPTGLSHGGVVFHGGIWMGRSSMHFFGKRGMSQQNGRVMCIF